MAAASCAFAAAVVLSFSALRLYKLGVGAGSHRVISESSLLRSAAPVRIPCAPCTVYSSPQTAKPLLTALQLPLLGPSRYDFTSRPGCNLFGVPHATTLNSHRCSAFCVIVAPCTSVSSSSLYSTSLCRTAATICAFAAAVVLLQLPSVIKLPIV